VGIVRRDTSAELRERHAVERELARRLLDAPAEDRRRLYGEVYAERSRRMPEHPLVARARSAAAGREAALPAARLLHHWTTASSHTLEIGAGDGEVAIMLAREVAVAVALDVSGELYSNVRQPGALLAQFDGFAVPLASSSIDIAYSSQVLEHLHPDDAIAQTAEVRRCLRSGGRYICVTPSAATGPHDVSRGFDDHPTGLHLHEWTLPQLASLMRVAGFARSRIVVSWHGYVLSPLLPVAPFALFERWVARLPRSLRQRLASCIAAVKIVAIA
jgi:SAM-dependent methyltransferase